LDSNVVAMLITNLGDTGSEWRARKSAAEALTELAKHGAHSDPGATQTLIESDDLRRAMFDSDLINILITILQENDVAVRRSAARALAELAKHGAHSDPGAMQTFI
jgi:HEAT repeat protein